MKCDSKAVHTRLYMQVALLFVIFQALYMFISKFLSFFQILIDKRFRIWYTMGDQTETYSPYGKSVPQAERE